MFRYKLLAALIISSLVTACGGSGEEGSGDTATPIENTSATGNITISGSVEQGKSLSVTHSLSDPDGAINIVSYQWLANGSAINGATSSSYTLTSNEIGKTISVVLTYNDGVFANQSKTSATTDAVVNTNDATTGNVIISGLARQGRTLAVNHTLQDPDGAIQIVGYQWRANGIDLPGEINATLMLDETVVDQTISVVVTYNDGEFANETMTSPETATVVGTGPAIDASNAIYVSASGSDTNDGSENNPYRSIAHAAQQVQPGDLVLIEGGTYSERSIVPAQSGTEGNYIVFRPAPGTGDVVIKYPATSEEDNPDSIFDLTYKNYIWIEGLHFKDFEYGLASIFIARGEGNVVINNRFENLGNEGVAKFNGSQVVKVYQSDRNVVCNNYFDNIFGDGIGLDGQDGQYNLLCYNTFKNFKPKARSWSQNYKFSRAMDIQDHAMGYNLVAFNYAENVLHHVWLDRDGSNNVILRNYGKNGHGNVFNESRCKANVIQENISVEMHSGYMTAYYTETGWTEDARWVNNVAYNNDVGFKVHKSKRDQFRNNIAFNNTDYNLMFTQSAMDNGPHAFANNLWFSSNVNQSIYLGGIPSPVEVGGEKYDGTMSTVAAFQTAVSETNGLSEDPLFANTDDFTLADGSPAKSAGVDGVNIGAYAVYSNSAIGWDELSASSNYSVYFAESLSHVVRGESATLDILLNKASDKTITLDIEAVAGDAVLGDDFTLSANSLTFAPGETKKSVVLTSANVGSQDELVALRLTNVNGGTADSRVLHAVNLVRESKITNVWMEAECGVVGENWAVIDDAAVSGGKYIREANDFFDHNGMPASGGQVTFSFEVKADSELGIWGLVNTPTQQDDSFWVSINGAAASVWAIGESAGWEWKRFGSSHSLSEGVNTLTIGIRENGTMLDKIYIGTDTPSGLGDNAINCSSL